MTEMYFFRKLILKKKRNTKHFPASKESKETHVSTLFLKNFANNHRTQIRPVKLSGLIWTQTV